MRNLSEVGQAPACLSAMIAAGVRDNNRAHMPDGRLFLTVVANSHSRLFYVEAEVSIRLTCPVASMPLGSLPKQPITPAKRISDDNARDYPEKAGGCLPCLLSNGENHLLAEYTRAVRLRAKGVLGRPFA